MEEDMISSLSDEVLSHILSFLPTEDAFTTSFLSKRWTSLWLLVPNLDLDQERFIINSKPASFFSNLVSAAIFKRSFYHQPIKKFRLICEGTYVCETRKYDFETWLTASAKHKLEHLEIQLKVWHKLPYCMFSLRYLVVLKLEALCIHSFSHVHFPLLKCLHLRHVYFKKRWFFFEFLNGCSVLEDFEAENIRTGKLSSRRRRVLKLLPNLVRASISILNTNSFPIKQLRYVKSLHWVEIRYCKAPVFPNLIHLHLVYETHGYWCMVSDVLGNCSNLRHFVLEMPPYSAPPSNDIAGPTIRYECFPLQLRNCTITNLAGKHGMKFVRDIVLNSKYLETMSISSYSEWLPQRKLKMREEILSFPKTSPTCQLYFK